MAGTQKRISLLSLLRSASTLQLIADKAEDTSRSNGFKYPFDFFWIFIFEKPDERAIMQWARSANACSTGYERKLTQSARLD